MGVGSNVGNCPESPQSLLEAWGIILRSGQAHFEEGVKEMAETEVQGIQTNNLRLASHTARSLYGTKYIPILGRKDPLKEKVMRRAHLAGPQVLRSLHNLQKTTMANVTSGELGAVWRDYKTDVKAYTRACGICRRFSEEKCRPSLGNKLFRTSQCIQPFSHIRIDPLGPLQVITSHMELLEGMEARDVYLALSRLETRFNIHIIQIYSDSGTQLAAAILGEKKSFYQERLGRLWAVTNNTPYSQFRNVAERKISMLKKIMKQVLSGLQTLSPPRGLTSRGYAPYQISAHLRMQGEGSRSFKRGWPN